MDSIKLLDCKIIRENTSSVDLLGCFSSCEKFLSSQRGMRINSTEMTEFSLDVFNFKKDQIFLLENRRKNSSVKLINSNYLFRVSI